MDRRKFLGLAGAGVAAGNLPGVFCQGQDPSQSASGRPNFLFIIADDLMYRTIHSLNNPEIHTPNMDRLANAGCAFTHCFHQGSWSDAVCMPSRTMLNTGLTGFRAQSNGNDVPTWGQTLGNAGYHTYICGKWHLEPTLLQRSFKELGIIGPGMLPSTPPGGGAYGRPRPGNEWQSWDTSLKGHWVDTQLWENQTPGKIEHTAVLYADCFIDHLLNKVAKRDAPFFMYLGFNSPHDPRQCPKEYLDRYPQEKILVPPNFLERFPFDLGDYYIRDEMLGPFPRTPEAVQLHRREYYALITYVDQQIGRILDALEKSGKASNTYVILTADHGLAVGEHGLMGKQNLFDCSVRMPLIISGPGIAPGKRIDEMVYQHCLYATTCELAGIPIPKTVEFPSIAPLIHSDSKSPYEAMFSYYKEFQRMVRTKTHKLLVYPQAQRVQLFDIEHDPWEMHDLSNDPAYSKVKLDLMGQLKHLQGDLGDKLELKI